MDLSYTPEYEAFRGEVKRFLAGAWRSEGGADRKAFEREFRLNAIEAGYLYRGVPKKYGGAEQPADVLKGDIIRQEFRRAKAPLEVPGNGVALLLPTLLEHGTEWQKERFIPKTLTGEYLWAQGYSEPGAGSDLASLRTKGELVGDKWVVNGQKVWTSFAHYAHYVFILVRTEPNAPKHQGISYLLMDLHQPGIAIRPLKQVTGESEFNELFLENATTPADWIVGKRGEGWQVSRSTLKHERSAIAGFERMGVIFESLLGLARRVEKNGRPAIEDPVVRERLAAIAGTLESMRYSGYRQLSMDLRGQEAGIYPLLNKLCGANTNQEMARVARDLLRDELMLEPVVGLDRRDSGGGRKRGNEQWITHFMQTLALSIAGGTANIQRNIIAERGLGLPRS
jgi:alkylation response protein AidB-like acyl-CoA dehydrogenase